MRIVIEDVVVEVDGYTNPDVHLTIEIDTDRMETVARRVLKSDGGQAKWAGGAIRAFLQEDGE